MDDLSLREKNRLRTRDEVLDAAERLLSRSETANFSMRELAKEAGMSFATPFNHFGSKGAVVRELSVRVIERMAERFRHERPSGDATDRVLAMGGIAVSALLARSAVYRTVVASLGTMDSGSSEAHRLSRDLWLVALEGLDGLEVEAIDAAPLLAEQLAFMFRGCLSFWIAGEITDQALGPAVNAGLSTVLLGFTALDRRQSVRSNVLREG
jgi:AcrR family transcriptional regulator